MSTLHCMIIMTPIVLITYVWRWLSRASGWPALNNGFSCVLYSICRPQGYCDSQTLTDNNWYAHSTVHPLSCASKEVHARCKGVKCNNSEHTTDTVAKANHPCLLYGVQMTGSQILPGAQQKSKWFGSTRFMNPWPSSRSLSKQDLLDSVRKGADFDDSCGSYPALLSVSPDFSTSRTQHPQPRIILIGHASVLLQIPWSAPTAHSDYIGILFDPIFSKRCSPNQRIGPKRFAAPPCTVAELPPIHICCISHDHYDHLDRQSILDLAKYHATTVRFFVPMGVKQWFINLKIPGLDTRVFEMDWFQESIIRLQPCKDADTPNESSANSTETLVEIDSVAWLKVACTPAQHRSGRGVSNQMKTLWCTWVVGVLPDDSMQLPRDKWLSPGLPNDAFRCFFGGDTGLRHAGGTKRESQDCPAFESIATLYGPPDIALLPVSTGSSLSFVRKVLKLSLNQHALTSSMHCSVNDALRLHTILGSKQSIGIHWGTFSPADEGHATLKALSAGLKVAGISGDWGASHAFTVQSVGLILDLQNIQSTK